MTIIPRKIQRYGWHAPLPRRNLPTKYIVKGEQIFKDSGVIPVTILPSSIDLRSQCPAIYDQGAIGSCTANALAGAIEFDLLKQKLPDFVPSRLFIYYNERKVENTIDYDSGASLTDGVEVIHSEGACPETMWPYNTEKMFTEPTIQCYSNALETIATQFQKVANEIIPSVMKVCLSEGNPFVFGFTVYESFESQQVASTGIVPMPGPTEKILGGHAVMCVGYDDSKEMFLCRNSWGTSWGIAGYFWIPYKYLTDSNLATDFWTIKQVS